MSGPRFVKCKLWCVTAVFLLDVFPSFLLPDTSPPRLFPLAHSSQRTHPSRLNCFVLLTHLHHPDPPVLPLATVITCLYLSSSHHLLIARLFSMIQWCDSPGLLLSVSSSGLTSARLFLDLSVLLSMNSLTWTGSMRLFPLFPVRLTTAC